MAESDSNQRVTLAVLRNDVNNLANEWREWRMEDMARARTLDERLIALEGRTLDSEKKLAGSMEDRTGLRRDVEELKKDVKTINVREAAWDIGNTLAGAVLATLVYFKKIGF